MGDAESIALGSPRRRALKTLKETMSEEGLKAKEALTLHCDGLDYRDRAFIMDIVYGVLRNRGYIDWLLDHFIRNKKPLSEDTITNLRMAAYQIIFMRIPERAAVFESVQLEKHHKGKPSFVNAVLRNLLRGLDQLNTSSISNPIERISVETSHPIWLIKRWADRFGIEQTRALACKNNEKPQIALRFTDEQQLDFALKRMQERDIKHHISQYCPHCILIEAPPAFHTLSEFLGADFVIQDEASQMVSLLLNPQPGMCVLDACSSPGGKAAHLATLMNDTGSIYAVEINRRRFELLRDNISRLSLKSIIPIHADVRELKRHVNIPTGGFDRILLDAPCSCLGVIRRNPDVRYRHNKADALKRFQERQKEMLEVLSGFLKPGGILLYSVCSTEKEEGEEVIDWFLQKRDSFSNIVSPIGSFSMFIEKDSAGHSFYRTYPHQHNMDGFFAALIKRDQ